VADQAYFNGDFYQCVAATNPGETPATHPAKWRKIQIPKEWRRVLARLTYANLLEIDGQKDKALVEKARGQEMLDDLVRDEANKDKWRDRPNVRTPHYGRAC
jgi:hypothetical protein